MTARTACPTHDTLERLLAGGPTDPPQAELFAHIEQCPGCVRTIFGGGVVKTEADLLSVSDAGGDKK